eukprot:5544273-Prymnesium_polylepis.2
MARAGSERERRAHTGSAWPHERRVAVARACGTHGGQGRMMVARRASPPECAASRVRRLRCASPL